MKPLGLLQNAVRAKEIFTLLARHGFVDLLNQIDPKGRFWSRWVDVAAARRPPHERIRLTLEELGPTFVKAGQLLSMRPDVLPHALILELRKLQNAVQPLPFDRMRPVLADELGTEPSAVFAEIGSYTAQGMAVGITGGSGGVKAAASSMAAGAVGAAGGGAAAGIGGSIGSGAAIHIEHLEIHANDAAGGKAAADAFEQRLNDKFRKVA